jgi:hypothetical protein
MRFTYFLLLLAAAGTVLSCKKEPKETVHTGPLLIFQFKLDSTQVRLGNLGEPVALSEGHAAQSPKFNGLSAHYIELAPNAWTSLGKGEILFHQKETTRGGSTAIDHKMASIRFEGQEFFSIPLTAVKSGEYEWLRISLAYQNYDVRFRVDTNISGISVNQNFTGTIASFIGYNTYIESYVIKKDTVTVNANKKQGYWGFEFAASIGGFTYKDIFTGEAPVTTVPNPIQASSPIPAGSCVVTGAFEGGKLRITGKETDNIIVQVSLSTNQSFEWVDSNPNGLWEPLKGEKVVDMGIRGMIPRILP